jgi:hypothetical protein
MFLLFFSSFSFGQDLIWKSYVGPDRDRTFEIAFYSDGSIWTQGVEFNYIRNGKKSTVLKSIDGIRSLHDDMFYVLKTRQTILNKMYEIKSGKFSPVELRIDGEAKTYYFTKFAIKEFGKALDKYIKNQE